MDLAPGTILLHYRLVEKIGEGGMGVVWKAIDTKLDREVAIKLLPPDLAADSDRLGRLEREARAVAALNHPNIVTVYSVEEADEQRFITMELVAGSTMRGTIPRAGQPPHELLDLAIPLADAVGSAHERGITHRDLKPDNVMITNEGRVKVLDFGLAKQRQEPNERPRTSRGPSTEVSSRMVGRMSTLCTVVKTTTGTGPGDAGLMNNGIRTVGSYSPP